MKDEYSELRAAFHAGARIQAWTLREFAKSSNDGYWRLLGDNQTQEEPKFSCEPHLYRVYPEDRHIIAELGQEVGAVAWGVMYPPNHPQAGQIWTTFVGRSEAVEGKDACWNAGDDLIVPLYTSPAHTSEARDAETSDVIVCGLGDYGPVNREMVTIIFDDMKIAECYRAEDAEYVAAALREYSSPAHTSEARDAGLREFAQLVLRGIESGNIKSPLVTRKVDGDYKLESLYDIGVAAMRQEAGND